MDKLRLYLVTDSEILNGRDFYAEIENALRGGVTAVQLREKNCDGKEFLEKAIKLRELTRKYGAWFIINDRIDIALLCDADGVHVGQSDIPAIEARKILGNNRIIGVSARTIEEAKEAELQGADYLGVGAIFPTSTKSDAKIVTMEQLRAIRESVSIPVIAIGGLTLGRVRLLKQYNIDGYAVISAILKKDDIYEECVKWSNMVR
ncbi:thiamine phosphate synthase [uncultured Clostridium sp.]|uniref:thiamine phosphate synthase n=1 Tax=uncultured Clostridium sp. TaxID=59620 RepID=UPI002600F9F8|nr:thiamine phosphate synthase [uncultured Clostridium sp.]